MIYCNWLLFSMFSGLAHENRLFRPFIFKMFSGLGVCAMNGHKVVMHSVGVRLGACAFIY
jgi:hypothetical protein